MRGLVPGQRTRLHVCTEAQATLDTAIPALQPGPRHRPPCSTCRPWTGAGDAGEASVAGAPGPQGPSTSLAARDSLGCTVSHWELRGVAELVARARTSHLSPETIMVGTSPADPWQPSGASTPPGMGSSQLHVRPAIPPQGRPARGDQLSTAL